MRTAAEIEAYFRSLDIPHDAVEFYNDPAFRAAEANDPAILESYGEYIAARDFDADYLSRSRSVVPHVARYLHRELVRDGKQGACIDATQAMMKILERLGIWCYATGGSLTVEFESQTGLATRFWAHFFEAPDDNPNAAGHAWLSAPPFRVIDITTGRQPNTEDVKHVLPDCVIAEQVEPVEGVAFEDLVDRDLETKMRREGTNPTIHDLMTERPDIARMLRTFRPFAVRIGQARLKYFPCRLGAITERFEDAYTHCFSGRSVKELFDDMVAEIGQDIGWTS